MPSRPAMRPRSEKALSSTHVMTSACPSHLSPLQQSTTSSFRYLVHPLLTLLTSFLQSNPCDAEPKVVGPCEAATPSWSFIKESGKCERFLYGGCEGTANRFDTEADCKETCNVVDEPPKEDCCPKGEFCCGTGCLPDDQAPFVRCSEPMCTCEPVEPEPCVCTLQFDPVCDPFTGTTYGNRCEAECANVDPDDLVDGECVYEPGPPGCTPTVCTHSIPPHCACV